MTDEYIINTAQIKNLEPKDNAFIESLEIKHKEQLKALQTKE